MLKGNCPNCNQLMQWEAPQPDWYTLYVVQCPDCCAQHAIEDDEMVPYVVAKKPPTEVMYHVFYIEDGKSKPACDGEEVSYEYAKSTIEAGHRLNPQLTYYMKPVLDGLA